MLTVRYEVRRAVDRVVFLDADTQTCCAEVPSAVFSVGEEPGAVWRCAACSFDNECDGPCLMCRTGSALCSAAAQLQVLAAQLGEVEGDSSSSSMTRASARRAAADVEVALQRTCKAVDDTDGALGIERVQVQGIAALDLAARGRQLAPTSDGSVAPRSSSSPSSAGTPARRRVRFGSAASAGKERTAGMGQRTTSRIPRSAKGAAAAAANSASPERRAAWVNALRGGSVDAAQRALDDGCPVDLVLDAALDADPAEQGGSVRTLPIEAGDTALLASCRAAHRAMALLLLERGAALDPHPRRGSSALHIAVRAASPSLLRVVLGTDRDGEWRPWRDAAVRLVDAEDERGEFALHRCVRDGDDAIAALLLDAGADPGLADARRRTPLHCAATAGRAACAALLLEHCEARLLGSEGEGESGAFSNFIDGVDDEGNTPLHLAAALGGFEVTELLLQTACRTTLRNAAGLTALEEIRAAIRRAQRDAVESPRGASHAAVLDSLRRCERIVCEYSESRVESGATPLAGSSKTSVATSAAHQHALSVRAHVARARWARTHWERDLRRGSVVDVCDVRGGDEGNDAVSWFGASVVDVRRGNAESSGAQELLLTFNGYDSSFDIWLPATSSHLAVRYHRAGDPAVWLAPGAVLDAWHAGGGESESEGEGEGSWAAASVVAVRIDAAARCADAVRDCIAACGAAAPAAPSRASSKSDGGEGTLVLSAPPSECDCLPLRAADVVAVKLHWAGWDADWDEWLALPEHGDRLAALHVHTHARVADGDREEGGWEVVDSHHEAGASLASDEGGGERRRTSAIVRAFGSIHRAVQRSRDRRRGGSAETGAAAAKTEAKEEDAAAATTTTATAAAAKEAADSREHAVPSGMCCPITCDVMVDPVMAADGHTYERASIETWLEQHETSPITNLVLDHKGLVPNHALRSSIEQLKASK